MHWMTNQGPATIPKPTSLQKDRSCMCCVTGSLCSDMTKQGSKQLCIMTFSSVKICQSSSQTSSVTSTLSSPKGEENPTVPWQYRFSQHRRHLVLWQRSFQLEGISCHSQKERLSLISSRLPLKNTKAHHEPSKWQMEISMKAMPLYSPIEDTGCNWMLKQIQKNKYWNIPLKQGTVTIQRTEAWKSSQALQLLTPSSQ